MAKQRIAYISARQLGGTALVEEQLDGLDYEMWYQTPASPGETIEAVKGADVIIDARVPLPREVIEQIDTARAIISHGHGFDEIDHNAASEAGIMVANAAGFVTEEVSNHTIMLLLACSRRLTIAHALVRAGRWADNREALDGIPPIDGHVLGLVGVGNIGRAVARKAKVFGLKVMACDPYLLPWDAREYGVEVVDSRSELASRSDYVSIHTPLNDETHHMIEGGFFRAMKSEAYIINVSRGPIIDEQALVTALQDGEIAGAGLDVFDEEPTPSDNPLLKMDNVIVTPHSAGRSVLAADAGQRQVGREVARVLRGQFPLSLVNPDVRGKANLRKAAGGG